MTGRYQLARAGEGVTIEGHDSYGRPFCLALDRVWIANLVLELTDVLENPEVRS